MEEEYENETDDFGELTKEQQAQLKIDADTHKDTEDSKDYFAEDKDVFSEEPSADEDDIDVKNEDEDKDVFEEDGKSLENFENIEKGWEDVKPGDFSAQGDMSLDRRIARRNTSKEVIRQFSRQEIQEVHRYVSTNIQYSVLQQILTLTEKPFLKAQVYTVVYRVMFSASQYVGSENTRKKILRLLTEASTRENKSNIYNDMYYVLAKYQNTTVNFGKHRLLRKIENFFLTPSDNEKINRLVDAFLVFAERQELMDIDKIMGLDLDNPEGVKVMQSLTNDKGEIEA